MAYLISCPVKYHRSVQCVLVSSDDIIRRSMDGIFRCSKYLQKSTIESREMILFDQHLMRKHMQLHEAVHEQEHHGGATAAEFRDFMLENVPEQDREETSVRCIVEDRDSGHVKTYAVNNEFGVNGGNLLPLHDDVTLTAVQTLLNDITAFTEAGYDPERPLKMSFEGRNFDPSGFYFDDQCNVLYILVGDSDVCTSVIRGAVVLGNDHRIRSI